MMGKSHAKLLQIDEDKKDTLCTTRRYSEHSIFSDFFSTPYTFENSYKSHVLRHITNFSTFPQG